MNSKRTLLVTGGAGFIGSNFIHTNLSCRQDHVVNLDKLTYAGSLERLEAVSTDPRYHFMHGDIGDRQRVAGLLEQYRPWAVVNFAAESHVDRSISAPDNFIQTNVLGTFNLLEAVRRYREGLPSEEQSAFRFLHVSTDEVYGSLGNEDPAFLETSRYLPNSPYSASKAASDHLVRSYRHTYGLPTLTTHCSNNYGPWQFPEKLVPLAIDHLLKGKPVPIYGDGSNVRDWLYVQDHCRALAAVLEKGRPGEVYHIGANCEKTNLEVVHAICDLVDELVPLEKRGRHETTIAFVPDRPGHDRRYAIDAAKIKAETGWAPEETFETGIRKTVQWYLDNVPWVKKVTGGAHQEWMEMNYGKRTKENYCKERVSLSPAAAVPSCIPSREV